MDSLEEKMLQGFINSDKQIATITPQEQLEYISRNISALSVEDRRDLLLILVTHGKKQLIKDVSGGVSVNMAQLDNDIIYEIYLLVRFKMN